MAAPRPIPIRSPDFFREALYGDLYITLSVPAIVPGQPIAFSFHVETNFAQSLDLGTVTAALFLVDDAGNYVFDDHSPIWSQTLPADLPLSPAPFDSATFTVDTVPAAQQNAVYKVDGGRRLRLVLTGTGADAGPHDSVDTPLRVGYETIDASWWQWTVDEFRQFHWKVDDYSLNGIFHNRGRYGIFTINSATLAEDNLYDPDPPDTTYSADQGSVTITLGGDVAITFSNKHFVKTWQWYLDGVFTTPGNHFDKTFEYSMLLELKDQFNNAYPVPRFDTAIVEVSVSQQKRNAAIAAQTSFDIWASESALALGASFFPPAALVFAAFATAAAGALAVAAKITADPPAPDPAYAHPVAIPPPVLPARLRDDPQLAEIAAGFELVLRILGQVAALSTIEGRVLGAHQAHDRGAEGRQRADYEHTVQRLRTEVHELIAAAPRTMTVLESATHVSPEALREFLATPHAAAHAAPEPPTADVLAARATLRATPAIRFPDEAPAAFDRLAGALRNLVAAIPQKLG